VTMTNVVTDQPVTTADASQWAGFRISVRPA
jgi:methenyltetrahydromethanopterin cyclohydrolase